MYSDIFKLVLPKVISEEHS